MRWRDDFSFLSGFALGLVSDRKETGGLGTAGADSGDYYTHMLAPTLKAGHCVAGSCSHLSAPSPPPHLSGITAHVSLEFKHLLKDFKALKADFNETCFYSVHFSPTVTLR